MALQTMRFVPDRGAIASLLHGRDGMVAKEMEKRALKVQAGAIRQVGKRTGKLARSIHTELTLRPLTGAYIGSNVRYALMHHDGTKRHPIVAKPGRMLTFTSNGRRVYARKVLHPGTAPNRYLTDNLIKAVR
jgi:hypothetical protein